MYSHENYSNNYDNEYAFKTTETFAGKPNLSNFTDITSLTGYETDYRTESYLGRIRYNYAEKYNLEVSFRRDGSSRFSKQNRWGNFGSIGANWIISEEDFMQSVTWINSLQWWPVRMWLKWLLLTTADKHRTKDPCSVCQNTQD